MSRWLSKSLRKSSRAAGGHWPVGFKLGLKVLSILRLTYMNVSSSWQKTCSGIRLTPAKRVIGYSKLVFLAGFQGLQEDIILSPSFKPVYFWVELMANS